MEWNLYFVADYLVLQALTQINQAKQDKFNESNHDAKTDNLKSCVAFGGHSSHPNWIEMQVNNVFNILDCWKQS